MSPELRVALARLDTARERLAPTGDPLPIGDFPDPDDVAELVSAAEHMLAVLRSPPSAIDKLETHVWRNQHRGERCQARLESGDGLCQQMPDAPVHRVERLDDTVRAALEVFADFVPQPADRVPASALAKLLGLRFVLEARFDGRGVGEFVASARGMAWLEAHR